MQKLVEMGFAEATMRSALEAVNGDEILAIKTLHFADCGPAAIETYRKVWFESLSSSSSIGLSFNSLHAMSL